MARRPTITDIAAAAGVSVATVDRVLNGRVKVRESTARRVAEAAHRIGYHASHLLDHRLRADLPDLRLGFLLHKERQAFYQGFAKQLEASVDGMRSVRGQALIEFAESSAPASVAAALESMQGKVDAIAATAINHPLVSDAVRNLTEDGIPVIALLSDYAQGLRTGYIGLNNLKVGRVAAWMLATAALNPGKIAIFVGGHRWHGHELRETGLRNYFREYAPQFQVLDALVNLETQQLTYEATLDLFDRHPDIVGIYVAGGGMEGAIRALREIRRAGEVALIVNELTDDTRRALSDRYVTMVAATPLEALCHDLVEMMRQQCQADEATVGGQLFLDPLIYLPESV